MVGTQGLISTPILLAISPSAQQALLHAEVISGEAKLAVNTGNSSGRIGLHWWSVSKKKKK